MSSLDELLAAHPLPGPSGGKDDRGSLLVIGGPETCPGAAVLAVEAALRSGAGRVQACVHPAVAPSVGVAVPEAMVLGWDPAETPPARLTELLERCDAVVIGPGTTGGLDRVAVGLAASVGSRPLVLDAGALPATRALTGHDLDLVLAPNPTEVEELLGRSGSVSELARALSALVRGPTAVRGATTAVADAEGQIWQHAPAATGLGTPGSGDVLMGVLGGLLAQGLPSLGALAWAVAAHGRAGAIVERVSPLGYLARDVVSALGTAFAELTAPRGFAFGEVGEEAEEPPDHKETTMPDTDDLKGRVKEAAGDLTDNEDLQREGKADQAAGKAKEFVDDAKDKVNDVIDSIKDRMHKD